MSTTTINYLFIGGQKVAPATNKTITVISPWTEEPVGVVPEASREDVDRAVAAAVAAQSSDSWGRAPTDVRLVALARLADVYEARKQEIADAMSTEMGCPFNWGWL